MTILADNEIKLALEMHQLEVEPLADGAIQPSSVDLHMRLPGKRVVPNTGTHADGEWTLAIDPTKTGTMTFEETPRVPFVIWPGELILVDTVEKVWVGPSFQGQIWGLSSRGREGLNVVQSCGILDPGFEGHVVLELTTVHPFVLHDGLRIAQVVFYHLGMPADTPYQGKYQNQYAVTGSRGI